MNVLTVNTGSSSVRLALYAEHRGAPRPVRSRQYPAKADPAPVLRFFLDGDVADVAAHRVVHGGAEHDGPCRIDDQVEAAIERLGALAPLHNPRALRWIRAARAVLGDEAAQVAVFDTAFYAQLPEVARTYALPRDLVRRLGLRRYGFHGIAHQAMWRRWCELRPDLPGGGRVVSLQLGAGCSITAVAEGRPLDTSMGFSPLEGLVMATRAGDVDPGLLLYLLREGGVSPDGLDALLNRESGLLGVSGRSADMRELLAADDPAARLAVELYAYRARKYVGAYLAVLGGADAILFGGGVGEHAPAVRRQILAGLEWAGIAVDAARNAQATGGEAAICPDGSRTHIWVMAVDEAGELARAALAAMDH